MAVSMVVGKHRLWHHLSQCDLSVLAFLQAVRAEVKSRVVTAHTSICTEQNKLEKVYVIKTDFILVHVNTPCQLLLVQ